MKDVSPVAAIAAFAGAPPEQIRHLDEMSRVAHHMEPGMAQPTCEPGPLGWWKANADWNEVDCVTCLMRKPA